MKLDKDERELVESVERGEWRRAPGYGEVAERVREYARASLRKDRRVNIRISERDLVGIQTRAVEEGLPYQTLISSVLHKFVTGRLRETP